MKSHNIQDTGTRTIHEINQICYVKYNWNWNRQIGNNSSNICIWHVDLKKKKPWRVFFFGKGAQEIFCVHYVFK